MNKLELELDEEKVLADGEYDLNDLYKYIDDLAVDEKGLRKEGTFYIEDEPGDDGLGMPLAVALLLAEEDWFRKYVKVLNCYWWDDYKNEFEVDDIIEETIVYWDRISKGDFSYVAEKAEKYEQNQNGQNINKLEIVLDEDRIIQDGLIDINEVHKYLDAMTSQVGNLRKDGNFYIEDNPKDGFGTITAIALGLSEKNWFRHYIKVFRCYYWDKYEQKFNIEDALDKLILHPYVVK